MAEQQVAFHVHSGKDGTREVKIARYLRRLAEDVEAGLVIAFTLSSKLGEPMSGSLSVVLPGDYLSTDRMCGVADEG